MTPTWSWLLGNPTEKLEFWPVPLTRTSAWAGAVASRGAPTTAASSAAARSRRDVLRGCRAAGVGSGGGRCPAAVSRDRCDPDVECRLPAPGSGSRLRALASRLSALGSRLSLSALGSRSRLSLSALGSRSRLSAFSALGSRSRLSALGALGSRLSALGSRLSALGSRLRLSASRLWLSALGSRLSLSALGSRLSALALGSRLSLSLSALGSRLSYLCHGHRNRSPSPSNGTTVGGGRGAGGVRSMMRVRGQRDVFVATGCSRTPSSTCHYGTGQNPAT